MSRRTNSDAKPPRPPIDPARITPEIADILAKLKAKTGEQPPRRYGPTPWKCEPEGYSEPEQR